LYAYFITFNSLLGIILMQLDNEIDPTIKYDFDFQFPLGDYSYATPQPFQAATILIQLAFNSLLGIILMQRTKTQDDDSS